MAVRTEPVKRQRREESFEQKIATLRATPEERARLLESRPPVDYEAWEQEAGPAVPAELAEMEELLREREEERLRSLADQQDRPARQGA